MYDVVKGIMGSGSMFGYFLQVVPITVVVAVIYCTIRFTSLKKKGEAISLAKEMTALVFVCYLTGLFNLIVMPANFWLAFFNGIEYGCWSEFPSFFAIGDVNLVPSVIEYLQGTLEIGVWVKQMFVGNIVMFLPLGFLLPFVTEKIDVKSIWIVAVSVPPAAELLQLLVGRSFDVDDLIFNFIGIIVGFFLAMPLKRHISNLT